MTKTNSALRLLRLNLELVSERSEIALLSTSLNAKQLPINAIPSLSTMMENNLRQPLSRMEEMPEATIDSPAILLPANTVVSDELQSDSNSAANFSGDDGVCLKTISAETTESAES